MTKDISFLSRIADLIGTVAIYASSTYGALSFVDDMKTRRVKAITEEMRGAEKSKQTPPGPQDPVKINL